MVRTITIVMHLTDKEYALLEEDANKHDYEVEGFVSKPISDLLYDILGDDSTQVLTLIEPKR